MSFNINYTNFALQVLAMGGWVIAIAFVYATVEKLVLGRPPESFDPKKHSTNVM